MSNVDIRWQQRLASYEKALNQLRDAVAESEKRPLSDLETQGLIQAFEFTHELAWKCDEGLFRLPRKPGNHRLA